MKRTEHTQKWLDALRRGEYKQGRGLLYAGSGVDRSYCCIGVACEVAGLDVELLPYLEIEPLMGIHAGEAHKLIKLNDEQRKTFTEIADEIEKMLDGN